MSKKTRSNVYLLVGSMIWGCAFVAQSVAADSISPWTFNATRYLLAACALLPLIFIRSRKETVQKKDTKLLWKAGVQCGFFLAIASYFQQAGIAYTSAGKAGFITALYVVLVPIASLFFGRKGTPFTWISAILSVIALYLLSNNDSFSLESGDFMVFLCALCFTGQILSVDAYADKVDGVKLACLQFFVSFVISFFMALVRETIDIQALKSAWMPILYAGIMSGGVGYTLQILGQRDADPSVASVLMSLESVFSAIFGFLILHEVLSFKELCGCILMFIAVILSQLSIDIFKKKTVRKA